MILTCPQCKAKYFVKDEIIGVSGTQVTCPSCGNGWFQKPDSQTLRPIKKKTADQLYVESKQVQQLSAIKRGRYMVFAGLAILGSALVYLGVNERNRVVTAWPESASLFRLMSLEVNRYGVEWVGLQQQRVFDGTRPIVRVSGVIKNLTQADRALPNIRLDLNDEDGDSIETRYAIFPYARLAAQERLRVTFDVMDPPSESTEVQMVFIDSIPAMTANIIRMEDTTE